MNDNRNFIGEFIVSANSSINQLIIYTKSLANRMIPLPEKWQEEDYFYVIDKRKNKSGLLKHKDNQGIKTRFGIHKDNLIVGDKIDRN